MSIAEEQMPRSSKKLDIVKNIVTILQKEKDVTISRFLQEGYSNKTSLEYLELINWIVEHAQPIRIEKIGKRLTRITLDGRHAD